MRRFPRIIPNCSPLAIIALISASKSAFPTMVISIVLEPSDVSFIGDTVIFEYFFARKLWTRVADSMRVMFVAVAGC